MSHRSAPFETKTINVPRAERRVDAALEEPSPGGVVEVARGIFWLRLPIASPEGCVNVWLLDDGDGWTVVDTGIDSESSRDVWSAYFDAVLGGRPINRLLITHFHPDHIGLCCWLGERFGAQTVMTRTEWLMAQLCYAGGGTMDFLARADFLRSHGCAEDVAKDCSALGNFYRGRVSGAPKQFWRVAAGDRLIIGDRTWVVRTESGHSPEHLLLHAPDNNILIAADHVLPTITPNISVYSFEPDADPLGEYLASFAPLARDAGSSLVLPSHGRPFHGLRHRCMEIENHHKARFNRILAACEKASTAAELLPKMFRSSFDLTHTMLAMGEIVAHTKYLTFRGALSEINDHGIIRYKTIENLN